MKRGRAVLHALANIGIEELGLKRVKKHLDNLLAAVNPNEPIPMEVVGEEDNLRAQILGRKIALDVDINYYRRQIAARKRKPENVFHNNNHVSKGHRITFSMPKRRYYRSKYGRRKRFRYNRTGGNKRRYLTTKSVKKIVRKMAEMKKIVLTYNIAGTAISMDAAASGRMFHISGIAQGNNFNERQGNRVEAEYVVFRGIWIDDFASYAKNNVIPVRIIIFWEQISEGIAPSEQDLLQLDPTTAGTHNGIISRKDTLTAKGFKILFDHTWIMGGSNHPELDVWTKTLQLKGKHMFYDGTTAGQNDGWKNQLYMWVFGNGTIANATVPSLKLSVRLGYRDHQ